MMTFVEVLLAFFATVGILSLVWMLFGHLLFPAATERPLCTLIPVEGDALLLEHTVRLLLWLRSGRLVTLRLILLDRGLSDIGQARIALLLAQYPLISLTTPDALNQLIEKDG